MVYKWPALGQGLWPGSCLLCGERGLRGLDLCAACRDALPSNRHACLACACPLPAAAAPAARCGQCQHRPPAFATAVVPYRYEHRIAYLIAELKFRQRLSAGRVLAELLADAAAAAPRPQVLLPVPLHPGRLAERGFNQSAELALQVGQRLAVPVSLRSLERLRDTPPQHGLDRKRRLGNLRGAFHCRGVAGLRHAAVIDDVVTTGATGEAIARVLRGAGLQRVDLWAVARTPLPHG